MYKCNFTGRSWFTLLWVSQTFFPFRFGGLHLEPSSLSPLLLIFMDRILKLPSENVGRFWWLFLQMTLSDWHHQKVTFGSWWNYFKQMRSMTMKTEKSKSCIWNIQYKSVSLRGHEVCGGWMKFIQKQKKEAWWGGGQSRADAAFATRGVI